MYTNKEGIVSEVESVTLYINGYKDSLSSLNTVMTSSHRFVYV